MMTQIYTELELVRLYLNTELIGRNDKENKFAYVRLNDDDRKLKQSEGNQQSSFGKPSRGNTGTSRPPNHTPLWCLG